MKRRALLFLTPAAAALATAAGAAGAAAAAAEGEKHLLLVAHAPKDRDGFRHLRPSVEVYDIDAGHKLVRVIPLPKTVFNIRGLNVSAATQRLYVSHYGDPKKTDVGRVLCVDLATDQPLWERRYESAVDRGALTPDGRWLYMPSGEDVETPYWYVIDAETGEEKRADRVAHVGRTHNTIVSLDGRFVFMQAFGIPDKGGKRRGLTDDNGFLPEAARTLLVLDRRTQKTRRVGPFPEMLRPFTINGRATLAYVVVNDLLGFHVADVASGKVLYRAVPPASESPQPPATDNLVVSHGIALTADEKEIWVVNQRDSAVHAFDVSGVPASPPRYVTTVKTRQGSGRVIGNRQPNWLGASLDGRYVYPESGEVIDTREKKIVGELVGADGKPAHSRFIVPIDVAGGRVVRAGDQFGVGRVAGTSLSSARR
jgi:DNA-binding beta-propeller fold protein YncE